VDMLGESRKAAPEKDKGDQTESDQNNGAFHF
jgi:hypothetical protein